MTALPNTINLFARFRELVDRAEEEEKRYGAPVTETQEELRLLNMLLDYSDAAARKARNEHEVFLAALRRGPKTDDLPDLKLVVDSDEWKTMRLVEDTTGGFLASATFSQALMRAITDKTPARQLARVVFLPAGTALLQPVRRGIQTAQRVSEDGDRSAPATGSDLSFSLGQVNPSELFVTTVVSRTALQDARYPLEQEIISAASQAFAIAEGTEFVTGTGAGGQMVGLDAATLPSGQELAATDSTNHTLVATDIIKLVDETLPPQYLPNANFLLNIKELSAIRKLQAGEGGPFLYVPGLGGRPGTILDIPYVLSPDMAVAGTQAGDAVLYLGDFNQAFTIVVREDVVVQRAPEMFAEEGKVAFFLYERVGGGVSLPDALARIVTA